MITICFLRKWRHLKMGHNNHLWSWSRDENSPLHPVRWVLSSKRTKKSVFSGRNIKGRDRQSVFFCQAERRSTALGYSLRRAPYVYWAAAALASRRPELHLEFIPLGIQLVTESLTVVTLRHTTLFKNISNSVFLLRILCITHIVVLVWQPWFAHLSVFI